MLTVYVLKLKDRKFYIGRTYKDVYERVREHSSKKGSSWTKIYPPEELIYLKLDASGFDADLLVKKYMNEYGINNVRGGSYSSVQLTKEQYGFIQAELDTANGRSSNKKTTYNKSSNYYSKNYTSKKNNNSVFGYLKNLLIGG